MASKSKDDLKKLMNISDQLAELNYQRFQDFSFPFNKENARQAVYSFSGDVYKGWMFIPYRRSISIQCKIVFVFYLGYTDL